jgi:hypothetical protein
MANAERTLVLLKEAGFTEVRTDEVPVRFAFDDLDAYERWVMDVAGPFAMVVRGLRESQRNELKGELGQAFAPFATDRGYEIPGAALTAVAS